jgi:hypothetical protein
MDDLNAFIQQRLDEERPARYDSADKAWMDPVVADVAALIPQRQAQDIAATSYVHGWETRSTRSVNKMLREIGRTGAQPLGWLDIARRPIAWANHRVRLDECHAGDYRDWAAAERRASANDFAARNDSCEGAERIADLLDAAGANTIGDIW